MKKAKIKFTKAILYMAITMKKYFYYFIAVAMPILFLSCGKGGNDDNDAATVPNITMTTAKAGEVRFYLNGSGKSTINWGDGTKEDIVLSPDDYTTEYIHYYSGAVTRTITITGDNITKLESGNNQLTHLNVSNNVSLEILTCFDNEKRLLTELDVSKNIALTELSCGGYQLKNLDVGNNTALKSLHCLDNQLTSLNVSNNIKLESLTCLLNQLTELDVSKNIALTDLLCSANQLTKLNVSNNTALTYLDCSANQLTELNVSNNTALTSLNCSNNMMDVPALEELFRSLHSNPIGYKSISITANPGALNCDITIAIAKGWTVY